MAAVMVVATLCATVRLSASGPSGASGADVRVSARSFTVAEDGLPLAVAGRPPPA